MSVFFISDLHIGHIGAIRFDNRPFQSLEEENHAITANWNNTVSDNEEVYILGDLIWEKNMALDVIRKLKGRKHMISGNHDKFSPDIEKCFESISDYKVIVVNHQRIVLSHYPIAFWYGQHRKTVLLYGHLHNSDEENIFRNFISGLAESGNPAECYNTGCMMPYMNYTPRTLEQIRAGFSGGL